MGYLIDPASATERETAERLNHQLVQRAPQLGGTCNRQSTAWALHKMEFLVSETGQGAVDMMRAIKRALDPAQHPGIRGRSFLL